LLSDALNRSEVLDKEKFYNLVGDNRNSRALNQSTEKRDKGMKQSLRLSQDSSIDIEPQHPSTRLKNSLAIENSLVKYSPQQKIENKIIISNKEEFHEVREESLDSKPDIEEHNQVFPVIVNLKQKRNPTPNADKTRYKSVPRPGRNFSNDNNRIGNKVEKSVRHDTETNDTSHISRNVYQTPVKNIKKAPKIFLIQPEDSVQPKTKKPAVPRFSHLKPVRNQSKEKETEKEKEKEQKKPIDINKGKVWSLSKPEISKNVSPQKEHIDKEVIENSRNVKPKSKNL